MDKYFGPLPREYCVYFYALSIFFGFVFVVSLLSFLAVTIVHYKKMNMLTIMNTSMLLVNTFLAYLVNRLLHTMCVKSI
uniref:G-protein coupled receptors family 1 profile domain-containing protein n=1 Tax=viral metagenome TaxID=1070528 RepID=A0A6C0IRJ9_9ZZZZ